MHVVHLYDGHEKVYDGRGSVPSVVWNLARRTAARDHRVTVVERQWDGLERSTVVEGVEFERLSLSTGSDEPWTDLPYEMVGSPVGALRLMVDRTNFARVARRRLADLDPDVVHVHLPFAANVLATLPGYGDRFVYTAHLGETEDRVVEPLFSPDAHLAKRTAKTVALNPSMRDAFAERGVSAETLTVIPNGVDVAQFSDVTDEDREAVRESYDLDADVVVLFVGTVTPRKGVLELAEAAGRVLPDVDADVELVVVGKTDMEPAYVEEIRETLGAAAIEDDVTLTGFVPEADLDALFTLADAFALPSHEEGSSISVAEAMAAGLPVIGTRIDGIRQQVDHGENGLLCEPGDVDALAANLAELVERHDRRTAMSEAMTDRAEEWSWDRVTDDVVDVYEEVAAA